MRLDEARTKLLEIENIPFSQLYNAPELEGIIVAKGNTGKLLEKILGLPAGNTLKDFEDGELKTNKSKADGKPMETMFISQISMRVDELLNGNPFEDSWVYEKIKRLVYVPVVKENHDPNQWYFLKHYYVEIGKNGELYRQLVEDYNFICNKMMNDIENGDGSLHTSSGKYIQIRTKDSKPYNPIHSSKYGRAITNKNFAFYFKKEFMMDVQNIYGEQI